MPVIPSGAERPLGQPGGLRSAATAFGNVGTQTTALGTKVTTTGSEIRGHWRGTASGAFGTDVGRANEWIGRIADLIADVPGVLTSYADALQAQQARWDTAYAQWLAAHASLEEAQHFISPSGETQEQHDDRIDMHAAAVARALAEMRAANAEAMAANERATALMGKVGMEGIDWVEAGKGIKYGGRAFDVAVAVTGSDLGKLGAGAKKWGQLGAAFWVDYQGQLSDDLENDLMSTETADAHALDRATRNTALGLGLTVIPWAKLGKVAEKVGAWGSGDFIGTKYNEWNEAGENNPQYVSPTTPSNPYQVSGVTPDFQPDAHELGTPDGLSSVTQPKPGPVPAPDPNPYVPEPLQSPPSGNTSPPPR